ncbi:StbB family protein [uncultured Shewanella sp.]|uniref:StbB family protein n=1 Tax=uncultured Shewanella sp. TaxID=173975 RepID=UPI002604FADA|nr:StbB family protein [uncultured Shewanella sp.]
MFLKIAIMNNSGNVGKSMICDNLLKPRIPTVETIKIETINSNGTLDETVSAKNIKRVFDLIDSSDVAVIDVGASNIETFMENLSKLKGAHEDIDFFFIPTTPKSKQQIDTISTVEGLLNLGVDENQIKLIFNFHDNDLTVEQYYPLIFESELKSILKLDKKENIFTITDNPVFDMLGEMGTSFIDIANDERDFKSMIRASKDKTERSILSHQRSAQRLAKGFIEELDMTFLKIKNACELEFEGANNGK